MEYLLERIMELGMTADGPETESDFARRARLKDLNAYIEEVLSEPLESNTRKK